VGVKKQSDIKDMLWVAIPKGIGGLSQLLLSLVLIRFMGPSPFGIVSVCLSCVLLLDSVFGSAIDMAIFRLAPLYRESQPLRSRQIEQAGLLLKPVVCLLMLGPLTILLPALSRLLFQDPSHGLALLMAFGALLGLLMFRSMQVHFQIEHRFAAYGVADVTHTAVRYTALGILLALGLATPVSILGCYLASAFLVTAIGLHAWTRPVLAAPFNRSAVGELGSVLKWYLPTVVVGSIASRMDVFFVSSLAGVGEAGIYGVAQMFALVPQLMGTYAAAVYSPRILPMWRAGGLTKTYFRVQTLLVAISAAVYLLTWTAIGPLGSRLLPADYQRAKDVILWLVPSGLAAMINFPLTIPLLLYTHSRLLLAADMVCIALAVFVYYLAVPGHGAAVAAAVTSGIAFLRLLFYQGVAVRLLRRDPEGAHWSGTAEANQYAGAPA
jgi:O-antigen/teichoic acid export membrane protein